MAEEALVQRLSVLTCTSEPPRNSGLSVAEDPFSRGRIQSFSQRRQHHGDLARGSFQTVEGRVAPGSEGSTAGLTAKGLDPFGLAMVAISDERVNVSIGDAEVLTLLVGASEALGVHTLGGSSTAFHLTPGADKRRSRSHTRPRGAGPTAGRAVQWGAWLEQTVHHGAHSSCFEVGRLEREPAKTPQQRQTEEEAEHEQEHVHLQSHKDPRCLNDAAWTIIYIRKNKPGR